MTALTAIVLAAGSGTRMKSDVPKVLHLLAGRPLLYYPLASAFAAGAERVVVVVSPATRDPVESMVREQFGADRVHAVIQQIPRGTGDAARVGLDVVESDRVMILCGDTPLIQVEDLAALAASGSRISGPALAFLTCDLPDPRGYGRVLRAADGRVREVREERDLLDDGEREVREVNAGVYVSTRQWLSDALGRLSPNNAQGEYYLTDVIARAAEGAGAAGVRGSAESLAGVNDRAQLAAAEQTMHERIAARIAREGSSVGAGARIDATVSVDPGATIDAAAHLLGVTRVDCGARVGIGCVLTDTVVGAGARLGAYCVITNRDVAAGATVPALSVLGP